ncbi:protein kinase domain-containing protein [Nocardioides sp. zg-1228]|uniref:protein kinase domain-containing protein n=1 Tax=Nocardioides sp. zg-1228 TaxID=2763008 RepID=UPI0016423D5A|nr:protein kinase [Nocardioides sp. zg-1228]MBC2934009.1 serine/threonine protein kinase [Nocardioides sp. zg-1228]QSF58765.1 serine/threonine protein kinase [Nocardioides sp. zg-1228]
MIAESVVDGRYAVGDVIGRGATAEVHRGHDLRSGRPVAIKVLRQDLARDPAARSRFRREARTVARLDHPAIVSVYAAGDSADEGLGGETAGGVPFLVLEYVAGRTLRELLATRDLGRDEAIHYQTGILAALDASHRAGVVHRDVKPANVMITPEGAVKLLDFGISSAGTDPAATQTHGRTFLGTPSYTSPEQVRGHPVDARSDLYAAGCVLHELLTGRPPFVGDDAVSVAYQHVHEAPAAVSTALAPLDAVLARALAKEPDDRFQDASTFRDALLSAA